MTHTPHGIATDFPDQIQTIQELRTKDAHFARMLDEYHVLNRDIHRAETNIAPIDDMHDIEMRRKRMHLKDQIARALGAL